ncbi:AraC family transcriptional regulator [Lederbergia sp. NSJ-179]|uniref:AraC family transcriptional regulator n=1 Tax=Lederbergia sp. NSJ-179 TaxID=2931402 RepID=UPI001FD1A4E0|nr:AraC family transcriptional regulator [Lederbergia sp. NSJ-179]MCJ7842955.1 AraC family transcriptional regulator [Lederbergia sp. NSJ-179]
MPNSTELITINSLNIFNELSELVVLRINTCNEVIHPPHWIESKKHFDYDLWYLQEGQIEIRINESAYNATAGDLILFSPKVAYTATSIGNKDCKFIFTHFDLGIGDHLGILDNYQLSGIIRNPLVKEEIRLFLDAYDQYKENAPMSGIRLKGCLTILIAKIIEQYGLGQYQGEFTYDTHARKQTTYLDTLQPVFNYIEDHLHQSLHIKDLAKIVGMSEKYFITYFKQALGVPPGRYIYQLKMNQARNLLYKGLYSIKEIAYMLGYPDPYSFSKAFKKYYKVPPSQFI